MNLPKENQLIKSCDKTEEIIMKEMQDQEFEKINLIQLAEYENCKFIQCDFSNQDLSGYKFIDCQFILCNLSLVKLQKTVLQDVVFKDCKLLGIKFELSNPYSLSFSFDGCQLNHASFYQLKIPKTIFKQTALVEVDFAETNLYAASFQDCDLSGANFDNTNLENADLRTAYHFSIHPMKNKIKKARFSSNNLNGLLDSFHILID